MIRRKISAAATFARREALAVAAAVTALLLVGSFVEIADDMAEGDTRGIDEAIMARLRAGDTHEPIGPDWLTIAAADLTALGSVAVLFLVVSVVCGLFAAMRHPRQATVLALAAIGAVAWSQGLKSLFDRPRPETAFHAVEVVNASFPSGHALISASVYLTLGALTASFAKKRRIRAFALTSAVVVTLLVGLSRVFLGVHFPSDVLAGWCLGGAWALLCWLALWAWQGRWREPAGEPKI